MTATTIDWFIDGSKVNNSDGGYVIVGDGQVLEIIESTVTTSGIYTCLASVGLQSVNASAKVTVVGMYLIITKCCRGAILYTHFLQLTIQIHLAKFLSLFLEISVPLFELRQTPLFYHPLPTTYLLLYFVMWRLVQMSTHTISGYKEEW